MNIDKSKLRQIQNTAVLEVFAHLVEVLIDAQERIDALEKELTELKKSIDSTVNLTDEGKN